MIEIKTEKELEKVSERLSKAFIQALVTEDTSNCLFYIKEGLSRDEKEYFQWAVNALLDINVPLTTQNIKDFIIFEWKWSHAPFKNNKVVKGEDINNFLDKLSENQKYLAFKAVDFQSVEGEN